MRDYRFTMLEWGWRGNVLEEIAKQAHGHADFPTEKVFLGKGKSVVAGALRGGGRGGKAGVGWR